MKKSFTLKAFAFGAAATVALAASATPHVALVAKSANTSPISSVAAQQLSSKEMNGIMRVSSLKNSSNSKKSPAIKAEANYGSWTNGGEGIYTFTTMLNNPAEFTYSYQIRTDANNEGCFQIQVPTWGKQMFTTTGVNAVFTVEAGTDGVLHAFTPETGIPTGYQGKISETETTEVYAIDGYHFYKHLQEIGYKFGDGSTITDEDLATQLGYCTYDKETGVLRMPMFYIPSFELNMGSAAWGTAAFETFRRLGSEFKNYDLEVESDMSYFTHEKDANTGAYVVKYNMYDNAQVAFRMIAGRKTGNALQTALQELVNDLDPTNMPEDIVVSTEASGTVNVPVTNYRKGQYTLVGVYTNGIADEDGMVSFSGYADNSIRLNQEDLDYYAAGTATYTDAMLYDGLLIFGTDDFQSLQQLFKSELDIDLPDEYTVTVPMQASSLNENEYRLVHPYAEYFNNYLSSVLDYDIMSDYLLFNTADATKSYILPSASGIYFEATNGSTLMITYGSTNKMEGGATGSADAWGTFSNGAVTFPELQIPEGATSIDQVFSALSHSQATFNPTSGVITYADWASPLFNPELCKIEGAGIQSGVENVAADAEFDVNAPVEYFNLQGIRVATPEAGQLLIKRQGNKASKVVIR